MDSSQLYMVALSEGSIRDGASYVDRYNEAKASREAI